MNYEIMRTKEQQYNLIKIEKYTWKDATSYRQDSDKNTEATAFETKIGNITILISKGHIDYKPEWICICRDLFRFVQTLGINCDLEQAANEAISICKNELIKKVKILTATLNKF